MSIEQPVRHLAIRVCRLATGAADTDELVDFLDTTAGPNQWLVTAHWLFRAPPIETRPGRLTIPAVCPHDAAERLMASRPHRVINSEMIWDVELRQWRWAAAQVHPFPDGRGLFPWEVAALSREHLERYAQSRQADFIASAP